MALISRCCLLQIRDCETQPRQTMTCSAALCCLFLISWAHHVYPELNEEDWREVQGLILIKLTVEILQCSPARGNCQHSRWQEKDVKTICSTAWHVSAWLLIAEMYSHSWFPDRWEKWHHFHPIPRIIMNTSYYLAVFSKFPSNSNIS